MARLELGYASGTRNIISMGLKASEAVVKGNFVKDDGNGYVANCGAGDIPIGVATETKTGGSSAGDVSCQVDVSTQSLYWYPPDSGTVTAALQLNTADLGGAQSIDIDASTDDIVRIHKVDTTNNLCLISLTGTGLTGVV